MPKTIRSDDSVGSARDAIRRSRRHKDPEEELCQRFLTIALCQAGRCGLCGESAEDCALGFVAHIITQVREADTARITDAWLWRCAINWVRNFRRSQRRRMYHERCYTDLSTLPFNESPSTLPCYHNSSQMERLQSLTENIRDAIPQKWSPEDMLLWRELREYLARAIIRAGLTPAQLQLLSDYYASGDSAVEIGCRYCRTANAIRQELWVLRSRIRNALTDMGINQEEVVAYLAALSFLRINPFISARFLVGPYEPNDGPTYRPTVGTVAHGPEDQHSLTDKHLSRRYTSARKLSQHRSTVEE